jgi:hypothetical protein
LIEPIYAFIVTLLPLVVEYLLVVSSADEKIIKQLLIREVIPCGNLSCLQTRTWTCLSEISRQSDILGLTSALTATFVIGAIFAPTLASRCVLIFLAMSFMIAYCINLFFKQGKAENPITSLTKHTPFMLGTFYLGLSVVIEYWITFML